RGMAAGVVAVGVERCRVRVVLGDVFADQERAAGAVRDLGEPDRLLVVVAVEDAGAAAAAVAVRLAALVDAGGSAHAVVADDALVTGQGDLPAIVPLPLVLPQFLHRRVGRALQDG